MPHKHFIIAIPSYTIFLTSKYYFLKNDISEKCKSIILNVGSMTFGIYLLEKAVRLKSKFVFFALNPYVGSMLASMIWILCAFIAGYIIVAILKKIPFMNKFI